MATHKHFAAFTFTCLLAATLTIAASDSPSTSSDSTKKPGDAKGAMEKQKKCWEAVLGTVEMPPVIKNSLKPEGAANGLVKEIEAKSSAASKDTAANTLNPKITDEILTTIQPMVCTGQMGLQPDCLPKVEEFVKSLVKSSAKNLDIKQLTGKAPTMSLPLSTVIPITKCTSRPELDLDSSPFSIQSLFFPANQLSPGQKLQLTFEASKNEAPFLGDLMVDKSSVMSSVLLTKLVAATKNKPKDIGDLPEIDTVSLCDLPSTKGKNKENVCAIDLETMLNYTTAKIGKDIRPASLWLQGNKGSKDAIAQEYTISKLHKLPAIDMVGCAKLSFPVAVFFCEPMPKAVAYTVDLNGPGGSKVKAPVICHEDTTSWNPTSMIFLQVNAKPGAATKVCHFLAADDVVWMPKTQENVAS